MASYSMVQKIRGQIETEIRTGKYRAGERLPTERELSERFNVSHMTIRRALVDLVEKQVIISRPRAGMFVGQVDNLDIHQRTFTLVACDYPSAPLQEHIASLYAIARTRNWHVDMARVSSRNLYVAAKAILNSPSIVLDDQIFHGSAIEEALDQTQHPAIFLGGVPIGHRPLPTISYDEHAGLKIILELAERLHPKRIAILWPTRLDDYPESPILSAIRQLGTHFGGCTCLFAPTPPFASEMERCYEVMQQHLRRGNPPPSFLFCGNEVATIGAVAALRDAGLRIPDDVAVISNCDSSLCRFTSPALTALNSNIASHDEMALELMEKMIKDPNYRPTMQIKIKPKLIIRQSTPTLAE